MSPHSGVKMSPPSIVATAPEDAHSPMPSISLRKPHDGSNPLSDPGSSDARFLLPKCQMPSMEEFQPVQTFVANAIASRAQDRSSGNNERNARGYQSILEALRKKDDPPTLRKVLLALRMAGKGSALHQLTSSSTRHVSLMHSLFRFDPFTPSPPLQKKDEELTKKNLEMLTPIRDFSLADAHLHLLIAIVSANSVFLSPALNALWRMVHSDLEEADEERMFRLHAAIATILRLVPKGNTELFPIMASNFPFRTKPVGILVWYCKQCLFTLEYIPSIHGQVLELMIDKCLEMDVEIKIDDGGQVSIDKSSSMSDDDDDDIEEEVFQLDLNEETNNESKENLEEIVDEMAEKLDSLLLLIFEHLDKSASRQPGALQELYRVISPVFDSSILTTHRSKFVQFLVLVLCGLEHVKEGDEISLYRAFAAKLIDIVRDPYRATVTRQSGACYLASFMSRASYVCPETICEAIVALLQWAEVYLESPNAYATRKGSDLHDQCELHSLFYTVCQSAFYMMCFRGAEAMKYYRSAKEYHSQTDKDTNHDEEQHYLDLQHVDLCPERWNRLCGHQLQPLRFCLESVRGEFLHVASVFQLLQPQLLNKLSAEDTKLSTGRHRQPKASLICTAATLAKRRLKGGVGGLGRGSNPLDSFFPFDPYLLRRSFRFIEPVYKNWDGSLEEDELMSDSEDDVSTGNEGDSQSGDEDDDEEQEDTGSQAKHMPESVDSHAFIQGMSYASSTTTASHQYGSPDGIALTQAPREAWSDTLKRSRAPSIESGSW